MVFEVGALLLCLAMLANTILNSFFLRRVNDSSIRFEKSVTVLVPVRNEEKNIPKLLSSLKSQEGIEDLTFCIIDDDSTDSTGALIQENVAHDQRFSTITGEPLPAGWFGKPFALQQGLFHSSSEVVVIVDADVRLSSNAMAQAAALLFKGKLDFLSCYPQQIAATWSERLIQPLLQWSWITTVPLRLAERSLIPAFAVANGQFFIVRRAALLKIGGFQSVKHEVLDDIFLARLLLRNGYRGAVVDGSEVASCRMYESWREIKAGYGKSLRRAFGGILGSAVAVSFLIATGIFPLVLAISGSKIGFVSVVAVLFTRVISAKLTKAKVSDAIFHPVSILLLSYLILYSWIAKRKISWKGRSV